MFDKQWSNNSFIASLCTWRPDFFHFCSVFLHLLVWYCSDRSGLWCIYGQILSSSVTKTSTSIPVPFVHLSRLCETSLTGKYSDLDGNLHMTRSIGLARSQEPLFSEDLMVSEQVQYIPILTENIDLMWSLPVKSQKQTTKTQILLMVLVRAVDLRLGLILQLQFEDLWLDWDSTGSRLLWDMTFKTWLPEDLTWFET